MNFISHAELLDDVRQWTQVLPRDVVAVAGVPRSGLLPALHLSLHRNLHLVTLDELCRGLSPWREPLRRGVAAREAGRVLVVDDSVSAGITLTETRRRLLSRDDCLFAAVYAADERQTAADLVYRHVRHPRCFEWNLFHCDQISLSCLDMDGVICEDWTGMEADDGPQRELYLRHLREAAPLHVPTYPVLAVVTSRLEKYRPQTLDWLRRYRVRFGELVMSPHASAAARQQAGDHAARKGAVYAGLPQARLFVESDPGQAREIARHSGRPVLCSATMQIT